MRTWKLFGAVVLALAAVLLASCAAVSEREDPIEVDLDFSDIQGTLQKDDSFAPPEWVFPLYFPAAPTPSDEVSTGHVNGATVISIAGSASRSLSITGVRIEQVLYRPEGASSEVGFIHPTTFEPIDPFYLELPGGPVIRIQAGSLPSVFEVDLATVAAPWQLIDADRDTSSFLSDQDETVSVSCSLFFEGYFDDGTEFSGTFPAPLRLRFTVQHQAPP